MLQTPDHHDTITDRCMTDVVIVDTYVDFPNFANLGKNTNLSSSKFKLPHLSHLSIVTKSANIIGIGHNSWQPEDTICIRVIKQAAPNASTIIASLTV